MTTVDAIAAAAFSAVSSAITDAVHDMTVTDGADTHAGRVVFDGAKAPFGFPLSEAKDRVRQAYLEGLSAAPSAGWEMTAGGVTYHVLSVRDIAQAGGLYVASVISAGDMLWQAATFERLTQVADGSGGVTEVWATLATGDVCIMALSGAERWHSDRIEAQSRWRVVCEHVSGLKEADRVTIDGAAYAITFVDDVEKRGIWQVLDVSAGVPA